MRAGEEVAREKQMRRLQQLLRSPVCWLVVLYACMTTTFWSLLPHRPRAVFHPSNVCHAIGFAANGRQLATISIGDPKVGLWDVSSGAELTAGAASNDLDEYTLRNLVGLPGGASYFWKCLEDPGLTGRLRGLTLQVHSAFNVPETFPKGACFSPDGRTFAYSTTQGQPSPTWVIDPPPDGLQFRDVETKRVVLTLPGASPPVSFNPDGRTVTTLGPASAVKPDRL